MGEDRRPNVAGRSPDGGEATQAEQPELDSGQRELEAKRLKERRGVDGHQERSRPESGEKKR